MKIDLTKAIWFDGNDGPGPDGLSPLQQQAHTIVQALSSLRTDTQGGYKDEGCFLGNLIILAGASHDGAPDLTVMDAREYVEENIWILEEENDQDIQTAI